MLFHTSFSHPSLRLQPRGISGQVTRSGQVTQPPWHILQLHRGYSFQVINMKLSGVDKVISTNKTISRNFDFGDLRSDQFCDQTMIRQYKFFKWFLFWKYERNQSNYLNIVLSQSIFDDPYVVLIQLPLIRVIRGYLWSNVCFASNFW